MLRKVRGPKLTPNEMAEEVSRRTFVKRQDVLRVFEAYADMVEECVVAGVSVPLPNLGVLDYKDKHTPIGSSYFNMFTGQVERTTKDRTYRAMTFRVSQVLRAKLRERTMKESTGDDDGETE